MPLPTAQAFTLTIEASKKALMLAKPESAIGERKACFFIVSFLKAKCGANT